MGVEGVACGVRQRTLSNSRWFFEMACWLVSAGFGLIGPAAVWSAEWTAEPRFSAKGEFNSNLLLTERSQDSVYGVWASPELNMRMKTEHTTLEANGRLDFVEYVNNKELDMTQQFYNGTVRHRAERHEFGLKGSFSRDSILLGELVETGVLGRVDLIGRRQFRKRQYLQPTWSYRLDERWSASVNYGFSNVTYDVPLGSGFVDYQTHVGSATMTHHLSEQATVYLSGQAIYFSASDVESTSLSYGGELGGTYHWTERLKTSVFGGIRLVQTSLTMQGVDIQSDNVVGVFGATAEYRWERFRGKLLSSRSLHPSPFGLLTRNDRFAVSLSGDLTEKLIGNITAEFIMNESVTRSQIALPKSQFFFINPSILWRWDERWGLKAGYHYRNREQQGPARTLTGESHAVTVTLSYVFAPYAFFE